MCWGAVSSLFSLISLKFSYLSACTNCSRYSNRSCKKQTAWIFKTSTTTRTRQIQQHQLEKPYEKLRHHHLHHHHPTPKTTIHLKIKWLDKCGSAHHDKTNHPSISLPHHRGFCTELYSPSSTVTSHKLPLCPVVLTGGMHNNWVSFQQSSECCSGYLSSSMDIHPFTDFEDVILNPPVFYSAGYALTVG